MLRVGLSFFISGIILGAGPCLASCGPLLISYIAGTRKNPREGLIIWFWFSLARSLAYLSLALAVTFLSQFLLSFYQEKAATFVYLLGGIFIFFLGILIIVGKDSQVKICSILNKTFLNGNLRSVLILGLLIGFAPCAPLIGILTYIGVVAKNWMIALFYASAFSLGTMVSPLLILAAASGLFVRYLTQHKKVYRIFQMVCGLIICILGIILARNYFLIRGL